MTENDVPESGMSLREWVRQKLVPWAREKLTPDARTRFILLFALFNAMFCLLVMLSLHNMELAEDKREMATRIQNLEESLEEVAAGAQETVVAAAIQVAQVRETVAAEAATQIASLFQTPTPVPPTVSPTYTLNPTYTSVPTGTPVPPTPTPLPPSPAPTPLPPTPTDTPVPPTPTPLLPSPTAIPMPPPTDTPVRPTPTSPPPLPSNIRLSASPTAIIADGVTTSLIRARVLDQYGNPVPDGTQVTFTTDQGTFGGVTTVVVATTGGIAQVMLTSSTSAEIATVNATSGSVSVSIAVQFMPWMQISKTVYRDPAPAGCVLTYTIAIQNSSAGGDDASLHTLTDIIPVGFVYIPGSTTTSAAFSSDPSIVGQDLIWTLSPSSYSLAAGAAITSAFQVTAQTTAGTYFNIAVIDGSNFAPVSTGNTAQVTLQGPTLSSIEPNSGCNDAPFNVTITGTNFAPGITANLGAWALDVTWIDGNTLTAIVPQDVAAGVYDLTVTSPGGADNTLGGAYTAQNCGSFDTTLDSGYLGNYGAEAGFSEPMGDDDQVQVLFLEVPDPTTSTLYIRVFDPDCGDNLDLQHGGTWDTPFTYTVYGGIDAYTNPDARSAHPITGASSGAELATAVFAENAGTDGNWYNFGPFADTDGECVGGKCVFKLTVVGGPPSEPVTSTADLNLYNVALSTSPLTNTAPAGSRIFAFSWTFMISETMYATPPRMFPYVAAGVSTLTQHNWDYDNLITGMAGITMTTPIRTITVPDDGVSGNGEERNSDHVTSDAERNTTWQVSCWAEPVLPIRDNLVTFWATDQNGNALAIFSRSTIDPPP